MLQALNSIDTTLFLYLNNSLHSAALDPIMLAVSYSKLIIMALVLLLFGLTIYHYKKKSWIIILGSLIAFGASDSISTKVFKDNFKRLRPCHNQQLASKVHLAGKNCGGGKFGFVSSHASNTFCLALFFFLFLRKKVKGLSLLFVYAGIVSYSRIYLARHYPADIFVGALLGLGCAYFIYKLILKRKMISL